MLASGASLARASYNAWYRSHVTTGGEKKDGEEGERERGEGGRKREEQGEVREKTQERGGEESERKGRDQVGEVEEL